MRTRMWIGLLALTLSAGVGAAGVMVVAERAFAPSTNSTAAAGPQAGGKELSPSEAPVPATVPGALARTVLLPPAMTPIDRDVPSMRKRTSCCSSHERRGSNRVPREC